MVRRGSSTDRRVDSSTDRRVAPPLTEGHKDRRQVKMTFQESRSEHEQMSEEYKPPDSAKLCEVVA